MLEEYNYKHRELNKSGMEWQTADVHGEISTIIYEILKDKKIVILKVECDNNKAVRTN